MSTEKPKVLIVEDRFIIFKNLVEHFEKNGYKVLYENKNKAVNSYNYALDIIKDTVPDLAVLDIELEGEKDGLDLAAYLQANYHLPIIILTSHANDVNIARERKLNLNGFVLKVPKSSDFKQLDIEVKRLQPLIEERGKQKKIGQFFKVKTIPKAVIDRIIGTEEHLKKEELVEVMVHWDKIIKIETANKLSKNELLLYLSDLLDCYVVRLTLDDIYQQLPPYFIRVSSSTIINFNKVDKQLVSKHIYFIDGKKFEISDTDTYKTAALERIKRLVGNSKL